jgi:hypothetical protein
MTDLLFVGIVVVVVVFLWMGANMRRGDSPTREETIADDLEQAKMLSRLYDDPDFIKDMGLDEKEQRYLHR